MTAKLEKARIMTVINDVPQTQKYQNSVYQSGQSVPVHGWYEAVGVNTCGKHSAHNTVRELQQGDLFPNFDGRAICWHLSSQEQQSTAYEPSSTKASVPPSQQAVQQYY